MDDMDNIFNKRQSILIANVNLNGKIADLFVNNEASYLRPGKESGCSIRGRQTW